MARVFFHVGDKFHQHMDIDFDFEIVEVLAHTVAVYVPGSLASEFKGLQWYRKEFLEKLFDEGKITRVERNDEE